MQADGVDVGQLDRGVGPHRESLRQRRVAHYDELDPVARQEIAVRQPLPYDLRNSSVLLIRGQGRKLLLQLGSSRQGMWSAGGHLLRGCRGGKSREQQGTGEQNAHSGFSWRTAKGCRQALSNEAPVVEAGPGNRRVLLPCQEAEAKCRRRGSEERPHCSAGPASRSHDRLGNSSNRRNRVRGSPQHHCSPTCSIKTEGGRGSGGCERAATL
jgi:hypothetical protein